MTTPTAGPRPVERQRVARHLGLRRGRDGGGARERNRRRLRASGLAGALRGAHDRARDLSDRFLAETRCRQQLLGAVLGTGEHGRSLCTRPLERLLDLGAGGVRELRRLMARLLEQSAALRLRLLELAGRVGVRLREQLARLVAGGVQHLGALALAFEPVTLDLRLAVLQLALAAAHLFLGLPELGAGGGLRIALDRVGELGGGADQVERVHADGMARRLDGRAGAGARGLEDAELRLQLCGMAAEGVEGVANARPRRARPRPGECPR